ncbi:MAG: hypothetical protein DI617_09695, partial [Streptococcus pyogenes]
MSSTPKKDEGTEKTLSGGEEETTEIYLGAANAIIKEDFDENRKGTKCVGTQTEENPFVQIMLLEEQVKQLQIKLENIEEKQKKEVIVEDDSQNVVINIKISRNKK